MQTADEVITFFRSKGFPASCFDYPVAESIRVSGREVPGGVKIDGNEIMVLQHTFVIFPEGPGWILRDCNWQVDIDEQFESLDELVSALVKHFAEWQADAGKSIWLGRTRRCRNRPNR